MKRKRIFVLLLLLSGSLILFYINPLGASKNELAKRIAEAVENGNLKQVRFLLFRRANIHILNDDKETLLHTAIRWKHKKVAELLIQKGIDINSKDKHGETPLFIVVGTCGYIPLIEDANSYCERGSHFYCENELDRAIEDFNTAIQLDTENIDAYFLRGRTWAEKGNVELAIKDWKEAIQIDWKNALDIYFDKDLLKAPDAELDALIRETVLKHLTDIDTVTGYAVYYGGIPGDFYKASLVLSNPFEEKLFLNMLENDKPVVRAMGIICLARKDLTHYEKNISLLYSDASEVEYVPIGCGVNHISLSDLTKNLINSPKELDCFAPEHMNRILEENNDAANLQKEKIDLIQFLLSKGAEVNIKNISGNTPLHYAASQGEKNITELLISKGTNLHIQNIDGQTPLHSAVYYGYKDIIKLLIEKGADLNIKDKKGRTPLKLAIEMNYSGIADLLRQHGAIE
ncbi:MAG: ankyrin repeat domain-containing protein [Sedimentisphaerales bacterium]|nr:ankyrin repeat domain-containing protein [Sedimentisphaerales bacterium]